MRKETMNRSLFFAFIRKKAYKSQGPMAVLGMADIHSNGAESLISVMLEGLLYEIYDILCIHHFHKTFLPCSLIVLSIWRERK